MGRSSGGVGDGGFGAVVGDGSSAQREMSTGSTAAGDEDDGGSIAAPPSASQLRSPPPSQLPPSSSVTAAAALSSNWTVISNSSLRDVNSDDLRDELVGYAATNSVVY